MPGLIFGVVGGSKPSRQLGLSGNVLWTPDSPPPRPEVRVSQTPVFTVSCVHRLAELEAQHQDQSPPVPQEKNARVISGLIRAEAPSSESQISANSRGLDRLAVSRRIPVPRFPILDSGSRDSGIGGDPSQTMAVVLALPATSTHEFKEDRKKATGEEANERYRSTSGRQGYEPATSEGWESSV